MRFSFLLAVLIFALVLTLLPGMAGAYPLAQQPGCVNMIANGNFEEEGSWELGRTPKPAYFSSERSHEGNRSAFLGNLNPNDDRFSFSSVWQIIEIPAEATEVTLNFWYLALSQDPEGFDEQKVVLINPDDGSVISVPWKHSGGTADWESVTLNLTDVLRGRRVKVYFGVVNDGDGKPTAMYLDEVSLMVCLPPTPTPTPTPPSPLHTFARVMGGVVVPLLSIILIGAIIGLIIASLRQKGVRREQR